MDEPIDERRGHDLVPEDRTPLFKALVGRQDGRPVLVPAGHCHVVTIRGNSYRMRQHTELWQALHTTPDPDGRPASTPCSSGGRDDLRLVPSPICRIFNRRNCRIFARR